MTNRIATIKERVSKIFLSLFIGLRYLKTRQNKNKPSIIVITLFLGIAGGLMVLVVVISIMNGFQQNHISRKIEVGSYHLRISKKNGRDFTLKEALKIKKELYKNFPHAIAIVPYKDFEAIIHLNRNSYTDEQIIKIRALDPDEINKDTKFIQYTNIKRRLSDLDLNNTTGNSIAIGVAMKYRLFAFKETTLFLSPEITLKSIKNEGIPFTITSFFETGSYDYDRYWAFISIYSLVPLYGKIRLNYIGIKFDNYTKDKKSIHKIKDFLGNNYKYETSQEINEGYFSALKLEKAMIMFLFASIFILLATNTFSGLKLSILEKKKGIAILKALGINPQDLQIIFIVEGVIIGFVGSFFGIILGILLSYNVAKIFKITEWIINNILKGIVFLLHSIYPSLSFPIIKIYDASIYYQSNFPVKINFTELVAISFFVIGLTILSAFIPILKFSKLRPSNILRNE